MEDSLVLEMFDKKTGQAYVDKRVYGKDFYFPNLFPWRYTPSLTYETLVGSKGRPIAADIVAYNASSPRKRRPVTSKFRGDIPAIRIARDMDEDDINRLNILKALANDAARKEILNMIYDDVDFVINGCYARMEWVSLQALSQGYVSLTRSNNEGIVTVDNIDFQMAAAYKRKIASATANRVWSNATSSNPKPITDIRVIDEAATTAGLKLKYMIMNKAKFLQMAVCDEVKQFCLPFSGYNLVADPTKADQVGLEQMNSALTAKNLPKVVVIDQSITIEDEDKTQTTANPWVTKYVLFTPDIKLGDMFYGPLAADTNRAKQATYVKKGPILVQKYADLDPVNEHTIGQINAFPSWPTIDRCYRFDSEGTPEADGLDN